LIRLQTEPIREDELIAAVRDDADGAVVSFLGSVRAANRGRRVLWLEYEAYPAMAERELARIADEARRRWPVSAVAVVHRTGRVEVGEASVAVAVAAPHRAEAFEACRYVIETLKRTVPIWKKEVFEDGAVWVEGPAGESPGQG